MGETKSKNLTRYRESFANNRNGYRALRNPERERNRYLHYEDLMNALRLKVNVFGRTLKR